MDAVESVMRCKAESYDVDELWDIVLDCFNDMERWPENLDEALAIANKLLGDYPSQKRRYQLAGLNLNDASGRAHPGLSLIRYLQIDDGFTDEQFARLFRDPGLVNLISLEINAFDLDDARLDALLSSPHLKDLKRLEIFNPSITDAGAIAISESSWLPDVETIELDGLDEVRFRGFLALSWCRWLPQEVRRELYRHLPSEEEALQIARREEVPWDVARSPELLIVDAFSYWHRLDEIAALASRLLERHALNAEPVMLLRPAAPRSGLPAERLFGPPPDGEWPRSAAHAALVAEYDVAHSDGDDRMDHILTVSLCEAEQLSVWVALAQYNNAWNEHCHSRACVRIGPHLPPHADPLPTDFDKLNRRRFPVSRVDRIEVQIPSPTFDEQVEYEDDNHPVFDSDGHALPRASIDDLSRLRGLLRSSAYLGGSPIWLQASHSAQGFVGQFSDRLHNEQVNLGDSGVMYIYRTHAFWQCS